MMQFISNIKLTSFLGFCPGAPVPIYNNVSLFMNVLSSQSISLQWTNYILFYQIILITEIFLLRKQFNKENIDKRIYIAY